VNMASIPDDTTLFPKVSNPAERLPSIAAMGAAFASLFFVWLAIGDPIVVAILAAILCIATAAMLLLRSRTTVATPAQPLTSSIDRGLLGALIDWSEDAIAITDHSGRLVTANPLFEDMFGGLATPPAFGLGLEAETRLAAVARAAWRDGEAQLDDIDANGSRLTLRLVRVGSSDQYLLWRFQRHGLDHMVRAARRFIDGDGGDGLGRAGIMTALVDGRGVILAANGALTERTRTGTGESFQDLLVEGSDRSPRFRHEGEKAKPLRLLGIPLEAGAPDGASVIVLLDEAIPGRGIAHEHAAAPVHVQGLLAMLPLGLSLVDRDGRFIFMNDAFRRVAGIGVDAVPVYPGDLVVKEDKAAVSESIRRFAGGRSMAGDIAIRLTGRPEEPIALTIATARGLGEAAVLLSLKDNSEESRLKRQVAQATKMQAVGQLAGGVAHDFNNILTAIIGHCDLMMMRHTPGDSDYDDIQQIKHNSNRAASLTRQLLAFSRQQTLRPQILQLPDVISEISNLLKRLLGETVKLEVKHGRNLGPVRADPGQLEQVIVNLAVNARDAMAGGGVLTLQTYAVSAAEARRIDSDVLPAADYTVLGVSDSGSGIAPEILGKIFEPFFTTKEVGKGTGLGLSTVYGIVKQTGGFIFADSVVGKGTTFTIYLPVHHSEKESEAAPASAPKVKTPELWGSGTILLVEDEAMVRAVAERALTRQGYQVLTATNGEEALEVLDKTEKDGVSIDLLISDVVMPMMDGPTLVGHARERFPDLPILFMSGYAEEQLRNSITIEHVSFLPKPFSVQQLCEAARETVMNKKA
jgi:two-component system, cell cycle sensor histidine kinase and response regulator CckA